jgi:3-oxoacyl-[acyl-carrier-protein] synthase-3
MSKVSFDAIASCGLEIKDIDLFIPHQANKRIIDAVAKKLSFPADKVFINIDRYGNTSAASIILALDEAKNQGKIKKGDHVLIVVFGAGFTWGGCIIHW